MGVWGLRTLFDIVAIDCRREEAGERAAVSGFSIKTYKSGGRWALLGILMSGRFMFS